jgi:hypothetical protein
MRQDPYPVCCLRVPDHHNLLHFGPSYWYIRFVHVAMLVAIDDHPRSTLSIRPYMNPGLSDPTAILKQGRRV